MKNKFFVILSAFICICTLSSFIHKDKTPKQPKATQVYLFGFSASFTDSIVYFTPIQTLPDIALEKKTKFLPHCEEYSTQLKSYLEEHKEGKNRICAIYSEENITKLQKLFQQMMKMYTSQKNMRVISLGEEEFRFQKYVEETTDTQE